MKNLIHSHSACVASPLSHLLRFVPLYLTLLLVSLLLFLTLLLPLAFVTVAVFATVHPFFLRSATDLHGGVSFLFLGHWGCLSLWRTWPSSVKLCQGSIVFPSLCFGFSWQQREA
ncbi:hypothetical protein RIF29_29562 [Crotalaria pallida]|uniref:Transmembrane protein n=1 Tax=Crotalaria pallida TaxID=3830 RepID=A0AAN9EES5_CROPI